MLAAMADLSEREGLFQVKGPVLSGVLGKDLSPLVGCSSWPDLQHRLQWAVPLQVLAIRTVGRGNIYQSQRTFCYQ